MILPCRLCGWCGCYTWDPPTRIEMPPFWWMTYRIGVYFSCGENLRWLLRLLCVYPLPPPPHIVLSLPPGCRSTRLWAVTCFCSTTAATEGRAVRLPLKPSTRMPKRWVGHGYRGLRSRRRVSVFLFFFGKHSICSRFKTPLH